MKALWVISRLYVDYLCIILKIDSSHTTLKNLIIPRSSAVLSLQQSGDEAWMAGT
jgi:hypothetical protein